MPRYGALPPLDVFPEPVATLASELLDLRVQHADLNREAAELRGSAQEGFNDPGMAAAQKADADLLAEAARNGADIAKVGSPNVDKLTAQRKDLATRRTAVEGALERVNAELHAALLEHLDETRSVAGDITDKRAGEYHQAIDDLAAARTAYIQARAIGEFCDRVEKVSRSGHVNYNPAASQDVSTDRFKAMTGQQMIASLKREADGGRQRSATTGAGFDAA